MVDHSLWELELPSQWVDATPNLWEFLNGRADIEQLPRDAPVQDLLTLLEVQGCLTQQVRERYSVLDIREIFDRQSTSWYGEYYSHPVWDKLREGSLSHNALVAWMLYNYHLSRSAGPTAARAATVAPSARIATTFGESALEEFSHCRDHYGIRDARLGLAHQEPSLAVQSPANLAFDLQMFRMAETDWVGHALSALFQEATARFYEHFRRFYRKVETNYALHGFFRRWEAHVELDLDLSHSDSFAGLLDDPTLVDHATAEKSLRNAWFAYAFLLAGLDDVLDQDTEEDGVLLRNPIVNGRIDPASSALLHPYRERLGPEPITLTASSPLHLLDSLQAHGLSCPPVDEGGVAPDAADEAFLRHELRLAALRALAFARDEETILIAGRIAETGSGVAPAVPPAAKSSASRAIGNFLREAATVPAEFLYLILQLASWRENPVVDRCARWAVVDDTVDSELRKRLTGHAHPHVIDALATRSMQLNELAGVWIRNAWPAPPEDMFAA